MYKTTIIRLLPCHAEWVSAECWKRPHVLPRAILFWLLLAPPRSPSQQILVTSHRQTAKLWEMSFSQSHIGFHSPCSLVLIWLCCQLTSPLGCNHTPIDHINFGEKLSSALPCNTALMRRSTQVGKPGCFYTWHCLISSTSFWAASPYPCDCWQPAFSFLKTSFSFGLQFLVTQALAENSTSTFKVLLKTSCVFLASQGLDASREFQKCARVPWISGHSKPFLVLLWINSHTVRFYYGFRKTAI